MIEGGVRVLRAAAGALLATLGCAAAAQTVTFNGMLGDRALLIVDGQAQTVAVGATKAGVKLVRLDGSTAQIEVGGHQQSLRLGGTWAGGGVSGGSGDRIVLPMGPGGHFTGTASINGHSTRFVVDTGATLVSIGRDEAARLGLDLSGGSGVSIMTANGAVGAVTLTLSSVRVGDVTLSNVPAVVTPQSIGVVLLGNSFLSRFQMRSESDSLVLVKK
jgi:aspartyl protease family protein